MRDQTTLRRPKRVRDLGDFLEFLARLVRRSGTGSLFVPRGRPLPRFTMMSGSPASARLHHPSKRNTSTPFNDGSVGQNESDEPLFLKIFVCVTVTSAGPTHAATLLDPAL